MDQFLSRLWQWWKRVARRIGEFQSRVFLTLLYFLLIAPLTLIVRAKDPLGLKKPPSWRLYRSHSIDIPAAVKQ